MKNYFDYKKMKRNENFVSFIKPFFTWRSIYVALIVFNLYSTYYIFTRDMNYNVCGTVKDVDKKESCGCDDKIPFDYYAYVESTNKKVTKIEIKKKEYNSLVVGKSTMCGEDFNSNYVWFLIFASISSIILIFWTVDFMSNDRW